MGLPKVIKKWWDTFWLQLTHDNSNLLGKSKKVRVIGSLKQITGTGEGMQEGNKVYRDGHSLFADPYFLFKVRRARVIRIKTAGDLLTASARGKTTSVYIRLGWTLHLNWSDKTVKTKNWHGCFELNSISRTSVHGVFFSRLVIEGSSYRR